MVTLVPDLYRGKVATDHETAGHYMSDLDWPGAVKDIAGAAKYLKEKGWSNIRGGPGGGVTPISELHVAMAWAFSMW